MNFYATLVAEVADDYDDTLLAKQQAVLKEQFVASGVPRLVDYTNVFLSHVRQYARDKKARIPEWQADLTKVGE